ncbi:hypothetical protein V6N11_007918 [Hibiscus sabdariffa]|uniref:Uncharacterized protein n=1 Tax=Hibiscus sabdariffa TaxID=183260 RepID=A0ABR2PZ25_9ROSI
MVTDAGYWDWSRVQGLLPEAVLDCMAATSPTVPQLGSDVPGWRWDEKREFRESILEKANRLIAECVMDFRSPQQHTTTAPSSAPKWEGPDRGWIKGNVDAAVNQSDESVATLKGVVLVVPSGDVADLVIVEQSSWRECSLVAGSNDYHCMTVDPGG